MTTDTQTECVEGLKTSARNRLHNMVLSLILLVAIGAAVGCDRVGETDPRLARSWYSGPASLILTADGTYVMTLRSSSPPESMITNESGKWGVNNDQLNLRNAQSSAITTYRFKLTEKDELQLTPDALNPNRLTVTYRAVSNP